MSDGTTKIVSVAVKLLKTASFSQFFTKIIKNICTNQKKCVSLRVFIAQVYQHMKTHRKTHYRPAQNHLEINPFKTD